MSRHISEQYDLELTALRDRLMEMGGLVVQQVDNACQALVQHDIRLADSVREVEARINQMEVELDDECVSIIARRQPAASDLRAVVSVMKLITDLERAGDEAHKIAKMASDISESDLPNDRYAEFRDISTKVITLMNGALDSFARLDVDAARHVIETDSEVDAAYRHLVRRCVDKMRTTPTGVEHLVNLMWAARALERVGDHGKNIAEYVIYQVKGKDVRHGTEA